MSLRYDFDMFLVSQESKQSPQDAKLGQPARPIKTKSYIAMFRDPALVKALRNADPDVRKFFSSAGFKLDVYDSGAPTGRYPLDHEAARTYCIERMTANFRKLPKNPDRNWNGFDIGAFTQSIVKATPIDMTPREAPEPELVVKAVEQIQQTRRIVEYRQAPRFTRLVAMTMLSAGSTMLLVSVVGAMT